MLKVFNDCFVALDPNPLETRLPESCPSTIDTFVRCCTDRDPSKRLSIRDVIKFLNSCLKRAETDELQSREPLIIQVDLEPDYLAAILARADDEDFVRSELLRRLQARGDSLGETTRFFISEFRSKYAEPSRSSEIVPLLLQDVNGFLDQVRKVLKRKRALRELSFWLRETFENYVFESIHDVLFPCLVAAQVSINTPLRTQVQALQSISLADLNPKPEALAPGEQAYEPAIQTLQEITTSTTPRRKVQALQRAFEQVSSVILEHSTGDIGADELKTVYRYILIKAQIPNLHSQLFYMEEFTKGGDTDDELKYKSSLCDLEAFTQYARDHLVTDSRLVPAGNIERELIEHMREQSKANVAQLCSILKHLTSHLTQHPDSRTTELPADMQPHEPDLKWLLPALEVLGLHLEQRLLAVVEVYPRFLYNRVLVCMQETLMQSSRR